MLLKLLFWLLVSLDVLCIGLVFVLGLAAAGPAKTEPLLVLLLLLVVPGAVVGGAVWLFAREATAWRVAATLVVAAPWLWLVVEQVSAQRWIATHPGQIWGSTELTHALYRLPQEPGQLATVRRLLAAGADPNEVGDELPLVLAIRAARTVGTEPLELLLAAGAKPNAIGPLGDPAFFAALGQAYDVAILDLLLARGADPRTLGRDGKSGVWVAANTTNWPAALRLLERGAPTQGTSPMGSSLLATLQARRHTQPDDPGLLAVIEFLQR
jgi:hypothetical protein